MKRARRRWLIAAALAAALSALAAGAGSASAASTQIEEGWSVIRNWPPGGGSTAPYDYAPTVIEEDGFQRIWWCGMGPDQLDDIYYAKIRLSDGAFVEGPGPVLTPRYDRSWQGLSVCDPTVVRGAFLPGDGHAYRYAMYYTASSLGTGPPGGIGVVYSDDGITWNGQTAPYNPIIDTVGNCQPRYGVGQAEAWNQNGLGNVYLFFTDTCRTQNPGNPGTTWVTHSVDQSGYHLAPPVQLSSAGIGAPWHGLIWNNAFAVDSQSGLLYVAAPNWRWCANGGPAEMPAFGVYSMPVWTAVTGGGTWTHEFQATAGDDGSLPNGGACNADRIHSPGFVRNGTGDLAPLKAGGIRLLMARDNGNIYNSELFMHRWTDPHP